MKCEKSAKILEILDNDCTMPLEQISTLVDLPVDKVAEIIQKLTEDKIILKNKSVINWELTDKEFVTAQIELKVTPQRGEGFDKIAERIYKFPEVKSLYLMAGQYDLLVFIEGKTMKEVALFVANRLAPLDFVVSTGTHFVLKKYKDQGVIFDDNEMDNRQVITL
jgi:DNA-binding Lrp family transcriptional regulator